MAGQIPVHVHGSSRDIRQRKCAGHHFSAHSACRDIPKEKYAARDGVRNAVSRYTSAYGTVVVNYYDPHQETPNPPPPSSSTRRATKRSYRTKDLSAQVRLHAIAVRRRVSDLRLHIQLRARVKSPRPFHDFSNPSDRVTVFRRAQYLELVLQVAR